MKKQVLFFTSFCALLFTVINPLIAQDSATPRTIREGYLLSCKTYSDIHEHVPLLRELAKECSSVVEIGLRSMISTWGIFQGLSENRCAYRSYYGIDIASPYEPYFVTLKKLAQDKKILFNFVQADDLTVTIPPTELLFIDSLHTYAHLTYELETFSSSVIKYIALHDTSGPWGEHDETCYEGDYSEYPDWIDRTKCGLWPAVIDFLERHPEWVLHERRINNNGFTILKRASF